MDPMFGIDFKGVVVNGYDEHTGLQFSRECETKADFATALREARKTPRVAYVLVRWPGEED